MAALARIGSKRRDRRVARAERLYPSTFSSHDPSIAGEIVRADSDDPMVAGTRDALRMLGEHPRFDATALQTVGAKGWDGLAVAVVI